MKQVHLESGNEQVGRSNYNHPVERERCLPRARVLTEPLVNVSKRGRKRLKRVILGYWISSCKRDPPKATAGIKRGANAGVVWTELHL